MNMNMNRDFAGNYITMVSGKLNTKEFLGTLKKVKMACDCIKDGCDQNCDVFGTVADVKNPNMEWHM